MSIDDPSVVEQVAELIADGVADYRFSREIAEALAEAGLLRNELVWLDPQPVVPRPGSRVWRAGDPEPEPEDVRAVLDRDGDVLIRDSERRRWVITSGDPVRWCEMLDYGPLVEVVLPEPVTK